MPKGTVKLVVLENIQKSRNNHFSKKYKPFDMESSLYEKYKQLDFFNISV
ncbi:Uncharacterised protein [Neisseria dentiae]|nr:Uncharacterised protein [Neisseria dentiae]